MRAGRANPRVGKVVDGGLSTVGRTDAIHAVQIGLHSVPLAGSAPCLVVANDARHVAGLAVGGNPIIPVAVGTDTARGVDSVTAAAETECGVEVAGGALPSAV